MELTEPNRSLWPETRTDTSETFLVLGQADRAQVLLPTAQPNAAGRSLIRYHGGMGLGGRVARRGASILARLGILSVMIKERRFVDFGESDDPESLRSIISNATGVDDFTVAISFGPSRANQKPVIRIMRPDGSTIAFAKVGWNPLTARLVDAEVTALKSPGVRDLTNVVAPRVLHSSVWQSNQIAVFEALEGKPGKVTPSEEAFGEVGTIWPRQQEMLAGSAFARQLTEAAGMVEGTHGELSMRTVDRLLDTYGGETFDFAGWHGDWAPWNNVRFDARRIALWDWERAGQRAPIGFDSIHYRFQPELLRNKLTTDDLIASSTQGLAGLSDDRRKALGQLYVATISLRHLQPEGTGGPVQRSAELLADLNQANH